MSPQETSNTMKPCKAPCKSINEKKGVTLHLRELTTDAHLYNFFRSSFEVIEVSLYRALSRLVRALVFLKGDVLYCVNCKTKLSKHIHQRYM